MFRSDRPVKKTGLPHLIRIKSGQTLTARIAGTPIRVQTHYIFGRTYPCISSRDQSCPLCDHISTPRYYAYWPVRGSTGRAGAVELTELAETQLLEILPDSDPGIGVLVMFHRPGGRRNNPVEVSIPLVRSNSDAVIASTCQTVDPDLITDTLLRIWGCPERSPGITTSDYQNDLIPTLYHRYSRMVRSETSTEP